MNKCKDCIYFKRNEGLSEIDMCYGECNSNKFRYGDSSDDKKAEKDILYFMDYEWYKAFVEVGESFGCIHFKEKEKSND